MTAKEKVRETFRCVRCGGDVTEPGRACLDCWAVDRKMLQGWG